MACQPFVFCFFVFLAFSIVRGFTFLASRVLLFADQWVCERGTFVY